MNALQSIFKKHNIRQSKRRRKNNLYQPMYQHHIHHHNTRIYKYRQYKHHLFQLFNLQLRVLHLRHQEHHNRIKQQNYNKLQPILRPVNLHKKKYYLEKVLNEKHYNGNGNIFNLFLIQHKGKQCLNYNDQNIEKNINLFHGIILFLLEICIEFFIIEF